jgi:methylglutaconyl-CoA hydratase
LIADSSATAYTRALQLASEMLSSAPLALGSAKAAIMSAIDLPLSQALDMERACYERLLDTRDRVEALEAFKQKRKPTFRGE